MNISIDTFVIHFTKLIERKSSISLLQNNSYLNVRSVITEHSIRNVDTRCLAFKDLERQVLTIADLLSLNYLSFHSNSKNFNQQLYKKVFQNGCIPESIRLALQPFKGSFASIEEKWIYIAKNSYSPKNIELSTQHLLAMKKSLEINSKQVLILEDDSIYNTTINSSLILKEALSLSNYLQSISQPCFIDLSQSLGISHITGHHIWEALPGFNQCCSAYIVNQQAIKLLTKFISSIKITLPIDWQLSYAMRVLNIKCFSISKKLFLQGSSEGLHNSNSAVRNQ